MFTGIVHHSGTIIDRKDQSGSLSFVIQAKPEIPGLALGSSICCSGVCLTVTALDGGRFTVEATPETLNRTTLGNWKTGTEINLEPSLKVGDELGGHFVTGHVDGIATVESVVPEGNSYRLVLFAPNDSIRFIAPKGSVTLDGISLTVNEVMNTTFGVAIIPHTWQHTSLRHATLGTRVNTEVDILVRYIARQMECR